MLIFLIDADFCIIRLNLCLLKCDLSLTLVIFLFQGHYCPSGSHQALRCLSGTYQDQTGQSECIQCPQGHFCDNTIAPVVLYNNSICLQGEIIKILFLPKTYLELKKVSWRFFFAWIRKLSKWHVCSSVFNCIWHPFSYVDLLLFIVYEKRFAYNMFYKEVFTRQMMYSLNNCTEKELRCAFYYLDFSWMCCHGFFRWHQL